MKRTESKRGIERHDNSAINKILEFLEKDRFTVVTGTIYLLSLGIIRSYLESTIFEYPGFSYYLMAQHVAFDLFVLVVGGFAITFVGAISPKKTFNVSMIGMSLILLPPLLDNFVYGISGAGASHLYEFLFPTSMDQFFSGRVTELISPGLLTMYTLLVGLSSAYVFLKKHSLFRALAYSISLLGLIGALAAIHTFLVMYLIPAEGFDYYTLIFWTFYQDIPPAYYQYVADHGLFVQIQGILLSPYIRFVILQQKCITLISYFLGQTIILSLLIAWRKYTEILRGLLKKIDISIVFVCLSAVLGIAVVKNQDPDYSKGLALDFGLIPHLSYIFIILMIVILSWTFIRLFSAYAQASSKKAMFADGHLNRYQYKQICLAIGFLALIVSTLMGWIAVLLTAFMLLLAYLPRTRASPGSGPLAKLSGAVKNPLPAATLLSFFIGFYSPSMWLLAAPRLDDFRLAPNSQLYVEWSEDVMVNIWIPRIPELSYLVIIIAAFSVILAIAYLSIMGEEKGPEQEISEPKKHRKKRRR